MNDNNKAKKHCANITCTSDNEKPVERSANKALNQFIVKISSNIPQKTLWLDFNYLIS